MGMLRFQTHGCRQPWRVTRTGYERAPRRYLAASFVGRRSVSTVARGSPCTAIVSADDRVLGRYAWAFISALVVSKKSAPRLVAALEAGTRPWGARDVPSDYYTFAGEIPWHPNFASLALAEDAYCENVRVGADAVDIEVLAHDYAWESYHSEMNRAGSARVPSRPFSPRFDLRSAPQSFDQFLPDGTPSHDHAQRRRWARWRRPLHSRGSASAICGRARHRVVRVR